MSVQPHHLAALVRGLCRGLGIGALFAAMVLAGMRGATLASPGNPAPAEPAAPAYADVVAHALSTLRCSTGEASLGIPASALVRTEAGEVKVVSFRRGWAVHQGRRPGTLIAVCHERPGATARAVNAVRSA